MANYQEPFLNKVKIKKLKVRVHFVKGDSITGTIKGFDQFVVIISDSNSDFLIYKNNITFIEPLGEFRLKNE